MDRCGFRSGPRGPTMAITETKPRPKTGITGAETRPALRTAIPGPRSKAIVQRDDDALATTTRTAPVTAVAGRGVVVEDADGNVLLDFAAGIGVLDTGHSHPQVEEDADAGGEVE